jgi:hypothetical protein
VRLGKKSGNAEVITLAIQGIAKNGILESEGAEDLSPLDGSYDHGPTKLSQSVEESPSALEPRPLNSSPRGNKANIIELSSYGNERKRMMRTEETTSL